MRKFVSMIWNILLFGGVNLIDKIARTSYLESLKFKGDEN